MAKATVGSTVLAGIDGCAGGWVLARAETAAGSECVPGSLRLDCLPDFAAVLAALLDGDTWAAVDIPIGLADHSRPGGRACDRAARQRLGARRNSVFSPPARSALRARSFDEARRLNGGRLNYQTYNLLARLAEADAAMSAHWQHRVREAHPELAFADLAGAPLARPKHHPDGRRQRLALLAPLFGDLTETIGAFRTRHGARRVGVDDVLDACVLVRTASRIANGVAAHLPEGPISVDGRGLEMAIWY